MKQKKGKRLLSFLLTLAMVIGLMPGAEREGYDFLGWYGAFCGLWRSLLRWPAVAVRWVNGRPAFSCRPPSTYGSLVFA